MLYEHHQIPLTNSFDEFQDSNINEKNKFYWQKEEKHVTGASIILEASSGLAFSHFTESFLQQSNQGALL